MIFIEKLSLMALFLLGGFSFFNIVGCQGSEGDTSKAPEPKNIRLEPKPKPKPNAPVGPPDITKGITLKQVFDEASKGPSTNIDLLQQMFREAVKGKSEGKELADMQDSSGDSFICKLLKLKTSRQSKEILSSLLNDLANPDVAINKQCADAKMPLNLLLEASRYTAEDDSNAFKEIIANLIEKGNATTILLLRNGVELTKLINVIESKGDMAMLSAIFKNASAVHENSIIDWVGTKNSVPISQALKDSGRITNVLLVDKARQGKFDGDEAMRTIFLYNLMINGDPAGIKGRDLAQQAPSAGGTERFSHYLAQFAQNGVLPALWTDYLRQIDVAAGGGGAGAAAVIEQATLAGAQKTPLAYQLMQLNTPDRNKIVKLMVEKNIPGITVQLSAADILQLLTVLQEEGTAAQFLAAFNAALSTAALKKAPIVWATTHSLARILKEPATPTVESVLKNGLITVQMVVDAAKDALVDKQELPKLELFYDIKIQGDNSKASGRALASTPPSSGGTLRFSHLLAQLEPSFGLVTIWTDFLDQMKDDTLIFPGLVKKPVLDQILLDGASKKPLAYVLGQPQSPSRDMIIHLFAKTDPAAIIRKISHDDIPSFLTAMRTQSVTQADFIQAFKLVVSGGAINNQSALIWAFENKDKKLEKSPANPSIDEILKSGNLVKLKDIVVFTRDAKVYPIELIPVLRFLFDILIAPDNTGTQARALAVKPSPQGGTPRFANFLARLPSSNDIFYLWSAFFSKLPLGGGGLVAVQDQINLEDAPGSKNTPFASLLNIAAGDPLIRQKIIAMMVKFGDQNTIKTADTKVKMETMLNALVAEGNEAAMIKAFRYIGPLLFDDMLSWAMKHRRDDIKNSGKDNEVLSAMRSSGHVDGALLLNEVQKAAPNWKKVLFYVQALAHDQASAMGLAALNVGGTPLHKLIAAKVQTDESVSALKHFLSFLDSSNWPLVRDDAKGGSTAAGILKAAAPVAALGSPAKKALEIFETNAGAPVAQAPIADAIINQGP